MKQRSESATAHWRFTGLLFKALVLGIAVTVGVLLAEAMVRVTRPGFPGFRLPQVEHRPVPGLGFEMVPRQNAHTWAAPARINSLGFRGPELKSPRAELLVLCAGDSMTFGNGVTEEETYPHQLQELLTSAWPARRPETVNMGVQRYFTYQEIDQLKLYAPKLRPDIVTLAVYVNDLGVRPGTDFVRDYEKEREQAARAIHNVWPAFYWLVKNSATIEMFKNVYLASRASSSTQQRALNGEIPPSDEPKWQGVETELLEFRALAQTHDFQPYVIFIPARQQVQADLPQSAYPRRLLDHVRRSGLTAIDPLDRFKMALRDGHDPYLPWDDHMSATGLRLVAEALMTAIREHPPGGRVAAEGGG